MGGKAFPDVTPIPYEDYGVIITKILEIFPPRNDFGFVGSGTLGVVNHRKQSLNDIDVAVQYNDDQWAGFISVQKDRFQTRKINEHCVSVRLPSFDKFHQVDFIQTRNLDDAYLIYFTDVKSKYKSAHRNIWFQSVLNVLTTREHNIGSDTLRIKKHFDFYEGIVVLVQTKDKMFGRRFKTLERIPVDGRMFRDIVEDYIPRAWRQDLNSFETLHAATKKVFDAETMDKITKDFVSILESCKLEVPSECQT